MRVLMTGITGAIGRHMANLWNTDRSVELLGTGRAKDKCEHLPQAVQYASLDITDAAAVQTLLYAWRPDVVIHSAAISKPNDCELNKAESYATNVQATAHVVAACKALRCRFIFMSSDMVFGNHGPYAEDDEPCPVNYYGELKVLGEKLVQDELADFAIVRTVLVYGQKLPGQQNGFPQWVEAQIKEGKPIRVFTDQYRTATFMTDLCKGMAALAKSQQQGVFHLCGEEILTPYEIALAVAEYHGYDKQLIQPITNADMQEAALRPAKSTLSIEKAKQLLGYSTTSLKDSLPIVFG